MYAIFLKISGFKDFKYDMDMDMSDMKDMDMVDLYMVDMEDMDMVDMDMVDISDIVMSHHYIIKKVFMIWRDP